MSHSEEQKWENHWRAELDAHAPAPLPGDWTAMSASLDATPGPTPEAPTPAPSPTAGSLPGWLTWPVMTGMLAMMLGAGFWLGSRQVTTQAGEISTAAAPVAPSTTIYRVDTVYREKTATGRPAEKDRMTLEATNPDVNISGNRSGVMSAPPNDPVVLNPGLSNQESRNTQDAADLTRAVQPRITQPLPAYGEPMILRDRPATYLRPGTRLSPAPRPKKRPPLLDNGYFPPIRKRF